MTDTNQPERIWRDKPTTRRGYMDGLASWPQQSHSHEGTEYIRGDLATPAPREDGYSAGVRAEMREIVREVWGRCEALEDEAHEKLLGDLSDHERGFWNGQKLAAKLIRRSTEMPPAPALPDARAGAVEPVAWTGSGSLMALQDGREGFIWPVSADAHPIPLYAAPPTPACTATDGPASACVYRAPGLGTAADWERG